MRGDLKDIFMTIYNTNAWGSSESRSGIGSTSNYTQNIQQELSRLIKKHNINKIIDTSCGDWNWMKLIKHELPDYTGIDIVEKIVQINNEKYGCENIRFIHNDFLSYISNLPDQSIDLILCRHTLEHLPESYNNSFLNECIRVSKYLLVTTHELIDKNIDINYPNTYRPINIRLEPYSHIMKFFKERIYDGPMNNKIEAMYILLFDFESHNREKLYE